VGRRAFFGSLPPPRLKRVRQTFFRPEKELLERIIPPLSLEM